jgi:hypothetical protein
MEKEMPIWKRYPKLETSNPGKEKGMPMNDNPTRDPTRIVTLDDTQHVAFLKMQGYKVTPWIEVDEQNPNQDPNSRRVEFQIEGDPDTINLEMQRFYADEPFPILTFCRHLKETKSAMYNLRRLKKS